MKGQKQQTPSRAKRATASWKRGSVGEKKKRTRLQPDRAKPEAEFGKLAAADPNINELPAQAVEDDFAEGFYKGRYAGGDAIVDSLLPQDYILPDIPIEDILAEGIEVLRPQMLRLITAQELGRGLMEALNERKPMSVVRLGEGELLTLAQDSVIPTEQLHAEAKLLSHKGVTLPDLAARDLLLQSLTRASVVGIPKARSKHGLPLAFSLFRAYHLDFRQMPLTDSQIHYQLLRTGDLAKLTAGRKVLLVGNRAPELAPLLRKCGVKVAAVIAPVDGMPDVPRVMEEIKRNTFDLALVSAGIPSVVIAERIAGECGKVAIDIGHLADTLVQKEAAFS